MCVSDTHGQHRRIKVPMGDVLVHLGDASDRGRIDVTRDFAVWFNNQPHPLKLIIYGNHDPTSRKGGRPSARDIYAKVKHVAS